MHDAGWRIEDDGPLLPAYFIALSDCTEVGSAWLGTLLGDVDAGTDADDDAAKGAADVGDVAAEFMSDVDAEVTCWCAYPHAEERSNPAPIAITE